MRGCDIEHSRRGTGGNRTQQCASCQFGHAIFPSERVLDAEEEQPARMQAVVHALRRVGRFLREVYVVAGARSRIAIKKIGFLDKRC
jgi:hypothetical protein